MNIPIALVGLLTTIAALAMALGPESRPVAPTLPARSGPVPIPSATRPMAERIKESIELSARIRDSELAAHNSRSRRRAFSRPETSDGSIGINFDDLEFVFPADIPFSTDLFTDRVRNLLGKRVTIRGYIHPASALTEKALTQFVLVADDPMNGWGPVPDSLVVECLPGCATDFTVRPITVVGTLGVKPFGFTGKWKKSERPVSVFRIEAETVVPPPPSPSVSR